MNSQRTAAVLLLSLTAIVTTAVALFPAIPQPMSYHDFADKRDWLGIPNFGDVMSNAGFAIVGVWGLWALLRKKNQIRFLDPLERWPYLAVFVGILLTAAGSSYYHLAPDNARLVWDRLPMAIAFMGLVAAIIAERISVLWGLRLLPVLLAVGVASVLQWGWSEEHAHGDLRFYAAVQLYAVLVVVLALLLRPRYSRRSDLAVVAAFYALAKIAETLDKQIFAVGHLVSGHTIKHFAAAVGSFWILRMLQKRVPLSNQAR